MELEIKFQNNFFSSVENLIFKWLTHSFKINFLLIFVLLTKS